MTYKQFVAMKAFILFEGKVILSKDHSEYSWIDPKSYKSYDLIDGLEEVFEEFLKIHEL